MVTGEDTQRLNIQLGDSETIGKSFKYLETITHGTQEADINNKVEKIQTIILLKQYIVISMYLRLVVCHGF